MKNSTWLFSIVSVCILVGTLPVKLFAGEPKQPNVILVITDDQGYGDLSFHGNPVLKTPNLDQLARESVRLTDYHVSPTCSPTRAALQTGHWTNRTGVWHTILGRSMLRANEITMGDVFKANGYATGMFGKWHLGDNAPFRPEDRGYTEVMRHGGGGVGQTPDYWDNAYFDGSYWHNKKPVSVKGFCTDVFFDYAKRFIKQQKADGKPFFAYISTNAPHGPFHSPTQFSKPYQSHGVGLANFYGMIANIDDNVGRLRKFLEKEGLSENTIFIFTTDNGTAAGNKVYPAGMRGKKGSEYDGGHRVPFFVHWPEGDLQTGRDIEPITAHVDVLPTLIKLCKLDPPRDVKFDGKSIVELLYGKAENWPDRILVTDSQRVKDPIKWRKSAVMTSRWRLVNGKELFDMNKDPAQKKDVATQHPEVVKRLTQFYESWWAEIQPTFGKPAEIHIGDARENPARLTSHDWITNGSTPWNQAMVRKAANSPNVTGYWNIKVIKKGKYEFYLRRWPKESDTAIDASLPRGKPVPGANAYRLTPGKAISPVKVRLTIGDKVLETDFEPGQKAVRFEAELEKGSTRISGRFVTSDGKEFGSYYMTVRLLDNHAP